MVVAVAMGLGYGNNQVNVLNQTQVLFRTTKSIRERYNLFALSEKSRHIYYIKSDTKISDTVCDRGVAQLFFT